MATKKTQDPSTRIADNKKAAYNYFFEERFEAGMVLARHATPVLAALSLMTRRRVRHLPVIDIDGDGQARMVGFVSIGDLVKVRIERIEAEAGAMREYIQTA